MSNSDRLAGLRAILAFDNWPILFFSRLFDRETGFVIYRKNGIEILVDHRGGDENGTRQCIASDMYRKYLPKFSLPGPVRVLDLGANGGGFPLMLKIVGIDLARVVSVEMNPLTYRRLEVNLTTNLGSCAIAINAAATGRSEDSEILLTPSRGDTGESIYAKRSKSDSEMVSVRATTFQALYDQYFADELIDICKIDIEGAEYELFESASDEVLKKIRYFVIEFHDPSRTPALLEKISALGFVEMNVRGNREKGPRHDVRAFQGPEVTGPEVTSISRGSHSAISYM